ncbi:MAG TPA: hypothetical protein VJ698_02490 [Noviherbaspirillum sp.]|uniref:O-linked N-acetylglucosamine transferase, SPINDLY family protein n=1 Tax=Noviherbaspirillum sp. TaxID=1926288 RepID=UPI002B48FE5A|nr:hypothetical protein [Noviherbaspirillum sp.]HJV84317.1 hypothetical protein [Noviherbaspirillum sp.]
MNNTNAFNWQQALQKALQHAQCARFDVFLDRCQRIIDICPSELDALLAVASTLTSFGFLTAAEKCYRHARKIAPGNVRPVMGLADIARDASDHAECRRLYAALLQHLPDHEIVCRNALLSLEYDPQADDETRFVQAKAWGVWALAKAGGARPRPPLRPLAGRPLRIGYLSADFCQHTVGLLVKDILAAHDSTRITAYAYSVGQVTDWVTAKIKAACTFRNVTAIDDVALANLIRQDEIDVLVDLSGHTAGSRLTVFAHRPAPVQVSWLGYFATTGLSAMDAVLLDQWHAPREVESLFVEQVIRLPGGRICYTPVHFAPAEVSAPPCLQNGFVTFGSFNNTGKLNDEVLAVWAQILAAAPHSRLVLKWRTFQDGGLCQRVRATFARLGIDPARIELRGASFHVDMLKEYGDVDIALDPFPFTGGLTSCEALWMGVPVVTWPQSRVVSRQTFAFLSAIGLPELAGSSADEYIRIALKLARDPALLTQLRQGMRARMRASSLMDAPQFARQLEHALIGLYNDLQI